MCCYFILYIFMVVQVGVGDGPRMPDGTKSWAAMVQWDGGLTDRLFDNFQVPLLTVLPDLACYLSSCTGAGLWGDVATP